MKFHIYKGIQKRLGISVKNIFNQKEKYVFTERFLTFGYRIVYYLNFIIRQEILLSKSRIKYGKLYFKKVYFINPKRIQYLSGIRDNKWDYFSRILGGDWDQSKNSLKDTELYQALKERFQEGQNWESTKYYQRVIRDNNNGRIRHFNNKEEWDKRIKKTELLYYNIKNNGFKTQTELNASRKEISKIDITKNLDEVSVNIGRDGQILCVHGRHRLSIAIILNLSKIPMTIFLRHKKWMDFRQNLLIHFRNYESNKRYSIITHPDLQDLPFKRGDIPYNFIRENISVSKGKVLDINARIGFFSHKLEDEGFDCYAQEENRSLLYLLKKLKKVENKGFKIISEPLFEYNKNQELNFDVVLALNGFYRYLGTEEKYNDLIAFLKRLRIKELILGTCNLKQFRKRDLYKKYNPDQFVDFIMKNSCLKEANYIGKTKTGTSLYKLTSERLPS